MKRTRRRALSMLLSAAMVLSLSCVGVFAADAGTTLVITGVTTDETTSTSAATHVTAVTYTENGEEKTVTAAADAPGGPGESWAVLTLPAEEENG